MEHYPTDEELFDIREKLSKYIGNNRPIKLSEIEQGGILEIAANTFDGCIKHTTINYQLNRKIKFCIINSNFPTAMAFDQGEYALIICSIQFITLLNRISMSTHCTMTILNPFLDIDGLIINREGVMHRPYALSELLMYNFTPAILDFTISATRSFISSLMWIAFHELGHIVNGHLNSGVYKLGVMDERHAETDSDILLTRRTLEFDADCFSNQQIMHYMHVYLNSDMPFVRGLSNSKGCVHRAVIAFLSVQLVFQISEYDQIQKIERGHPSAITRLLYSLQYITEIAQGIKKPDVNSEATFDEANLVQMTWQSFEGALAEWAVEPLTVQEVTEAEQRFPIEREAMLRRWAEIRPRLMATKHGSHKLAPAQY